MPQDNPKQILSRNTVLLQGAGRSNIVYSAGPNIDITNDVISGRDWSQEIADAVASGNDGVKGQIKGGDNIAITSGASGTIIVSVSGDLYSAGPNIDITDKVISGKDWNQDIDDKIASALDDFEGYTAGANINITDRVISGKNWQPLIDEKLDATAYNEAVSSFATHGEVNTVSSELIEIISATSGQGSSGGCIWISGAKDYDGETLQLSADSVIPILSGWDLSGDHNHSICMKGRYIRMPGSADFYTRNEWNNFYSAGWSPNINALYSSAAYLNANKLDISAFTAYSAAHSGDDNAPYSGADGIAVEDHIISITGDVGKTYSAGANININSQNVISGKNWQPEIDAAVSGKQDTMSAGSNIYIYNNTISGKDWSTDIQSAVSGKADTTAIPEYPETKPLSAGPGIAIYDNNDAIAIACTVDPGSASIDPYIAGANINITDQVISGRNWQPDINSATSGKLDTSATTTWDKEAYIAGTNINISNHVVSGKDWSQEITSATSGKADKSEIPTVVEYSAGANINIQNHVVSGKDWTNTIKDIAESAVSAYDPEPYVAGDNINITDHTVSGKDWTNEIVSATSGKQDNLSAGDNIQISGNVISVTGELGKIYTGVSPIQVDNVENKISLDRDANYTFIPGLNVSFTEDDVLKTVTINSTYDAGAQIEAAVSGKLDSSALSPAISAFIPYSAILAVSDGEHPCIQAIKNVNTNEWYHLSGDYAFSASRADWARKDENGRPLTGLQATSAMSAYIPFSAIDGDSATSSISAINGSACAGGDKIKYYYNTPVTSVVTEGDLQITRLVAASAPDKIRVQVDETDVGLLVPANTGHNSMLVTNSQGSVQWADQSDLIPAAYTGTTYKCLICTAEDQEEGLLNFPPTSANFTYTLINGNQTADVYYSAGAGTATLDPGESVTMMWDAANQNLYATPVTEVADVFDTVACRWRDLDNMRLERVSSSAEATERGVLYVVTGSN